MEGSQKIDNEIKSEPLIDDIQFFGNKAELNDHELNGGMTFETDAYSSSFKDANDALPELHESAEPVQSQRNGRYNLRQSLAWDSSFFTNAGVLDPEELSSMMTGANKVGKHFLPGIEEDISGSTESISTLQSDNLTLDSVEDDLFLDIRASIQRSSRRTSNLTSSNSKPTVVEVDSAAISSLKKEGIASKNKDTRPAPKKNSNLQPVRMSKFQPKQNTENLGTRRTVKQDSGHPQATQLKSTANVGEAKSLLPNPPKGIRRPVPASREPTKRDSVGTGCIKSECGNSKLAAAPSKNVQPPKISNAARVLPKPVVSSKSSSLGSSTTNRQHSTRSSASSDSSSVISSGTSATSPLMMARRKPIKNDNFRTATSSLISKSPSRAAFKSKVPSSTLSTYLMSAKTSTSVSLSPASSISEWSSASSSSSMVNQRSQDTSSCRSVNGDIVLSELRCDSQDRILKGHESQEAALLDQNTNKSSTPADEHRDQVRPSGLRMPSPKIGFFDGVKSSGRTPKGPLRPQSSLHTALPKSRAVVSSPTSTASIKQKNNKVSTSTNVVALASTISDIPKAVCPTSSQENKLAPLKDSNVQSDVIDSFVESCQKESAILGKGEIKQVADAGKELNISCNIGDFNNEKVLAASEGMNTGEVKRAPVKTNVLDLTDTNIQKTDRDEEVQNLLKNYPCPILEANDKENCLVKCGGEKLSGYNADMDVNALSFPPKDSQSAAPRAPLALKNVFSYIDSMDVVKEPVSELKDNDPVTLFTSE